MRGLFLHTASSVLRFMPEPQTAPNSAREPRLAGYRRGVRAVSPLLPAVLAFGVSFGVLAEAAGFGATASIAMSLTTFAGSAQFAVVSVLGAGGTVAAAIVAAVLLNARYGPMGLAAADVFRGGRLRRLLEAQLLVDESWAIAGRSGRFERGLLIGAGLLFYVLWIAGTAVGVLFGDSLGDPEAIGLDAAFPALFLALLWPYVQTEPGRTAAVLGALVAFVLVPIAPPGVPIVAAALVCLLGLRR
jgi:branched chain amino acid efflux pump